MYSSSTSWSSFSLQFIFPVSPFRLTVSLFHSSTKIINDNLPPPPSQLIPPLPKNLCFPLLHPFTVYSSWATCLLSTRSRVSIKAAQLPSTSSTPASKPAWRPRKRRCRWSRGKSPKAKEWRPKTHWNPRPIWRVNQTLPVGLSLIQCDNFLYFIPFTRASSSSLFSFRVSLHLVTFPHFVGENVARTP